MHVYTKNEVTLIYSITFHPRLEGEKLNYVTRFVIEESDSTPVHTDWNEESIELSVSEMR